MNNINITFKSSANRNRFGELYYDISIRNDVISISSGYKLCQSEWNANSKSIVLCKSDAARRSELIEIEHSLYWDIFQLNEIINSSPTSIEKEFSDCGTSSLFRFVQRLELDLKLAGRERASETLRYTLRSFIRYRRGRDIRLSELTSEEMIMYENYLKARGLKRNTTSFYMRN